MTAQSRIQLPTYLKLADNMVALGLGLHHLDLVLDVTQFAATTNIFLAEGLLWRVLLWSKVDESRENER